MNTAILLFFRNVFILTDEAIAKKIIFGIHPEETHQNIAINVINDLE